MINVRLQGGLGNQMFQYAMGRSLQERGREVTFFKLDVHTGPEEPHHHFSKPMYGLHGFNTQVTFGEAVGEMRMDSNLLYKPNFYHTNDDCTLWGHWVSEKYFLLIRELLYKEFEPVAELSDYTIQMRERLLSTNSVVLGVRRGDFTEPHNIIFHGVMPVDYYTQALEIIRKYDPNVEIFISTDDAEWCKQNLQGTIIEPNSRFEKLYLIGCAKHVVIANSTYHWWGAYLSERHKRHGIIVAPKRWFVPEEPDSRDVIPERWFRI